MNKQVYLSNLEWKKTHDNMGGVKASLIFKDNMSYEEYKELCKKIFFILNNVDLQTRWNSLREWLEREYKDYKPIDSFFDGTLNVVEDVLDKMNELEGEDND